MEILRVRSTITLRDLAELEHDKNLKEAHLRWLHDPVKEALPILKRCTNLRRLTLAIWRDSVNPSFPPSEEFCDLIMELKYLTFLHIIHRDILYCDHFQSEVDEVKAFVLPRRPNFKFYVSCCYKFIESRVPTEFFYC